MSNSLLCNHNGKNDHDIAPTYSRFLYCRQRPLGCRRCLESRRGARCLGISGSTRASWCWTLPLEKLFRRRDLRGQGLGRLTAACKRYMSLMPTDDERTSRASLEHLQRCKSGASAPVCTLGFLVGRTGHLIFNQKAGPRITMSADDILAEDG